MVHEKRGGVAFVCVDGALPAFVCACVVASTVHIISKMKFRAHEMCACVCVCMLRISTHAQFWQRFAVQLAHIMHQMLFAYDNLSMRPGAANGSPTPPSGRRSLAPQYLCAICGGGIGRVRGRPAQHFGQCAYGVCALWCGRRELVGPDTVLMVYFACTAVGVCE